jgi:maltose-binding protein MalE
MNNLPAIRALLDSPKLTTGSPSKRSLGVVLRDIAGVSKNARFFPTLPVSRYYRDVITNAIEAAELHQKSPAQALRDAQKQVEQELIRYQSGPSG